MATKNELPLEQTDSLLPIRIHDEKSNSISQPSAFFSLSFRLIVSWLHLMACFCVSFPISLASVAQPSSSQLD